MDHQDVLDALADPTRRTLVERLRGGPCTVGELVAVVPVTQSAVSQHLRALREAGLVESRPEGRHRVYRIRREGLDSLRRYVESFWDDVLEAYRDSWTEQ